ncbi:MAG: polyphenol oxidase family protein [Chthoniobacteraceae bacterium]
MTPDQSWEKFPALTELAVVRHGFVGRVTGVDVRTDREMALARLETAHVAARASLGLANRRFICAEQVHGCEVGIVDAATTAPVPNTDGLITTDPAICLGIYVADCGPVYLVDPVRKVTALLHSGRKGTELGITTIALKKMRDHFGCEPSDIVAQLGPCIRPPHYEIDFAGAIIEQCRAAGVQAVHDCGRCTATERDRYYSYRMEKGKTGRMLALLGLA